jgi:Domain of unknown function (DUF4365)
MGDWVLDARQHQGKFGEDYVRVLASAAGLVVQNDDIDVDGVDLGLKFPGRVGPRSSPAIEVQVKTWSAPRVVDGRYAYPGLTERGFNRLAGDDYTVPRFLFVVMVPDSAEQYADFWTEGVLLRHLCYFHSLRDQPRLPRPRRDRHRTVHIPTANVLTLRTLRTLLDPALAVAGA